MKNLITKTDFIRFFEKRINEINAWLVLNRINYTVETTLELNKKLLEIFKG
jgi:hypothetical protein